LRKSLVQLGAKGWLGLGEPFSGIPVFFPNLFVVVWFFCLG